MKRLIALIAAITLCMSLFAGCKKKPDADPDGSDSSSVSSDPNAVVEETREKQDFGGKEFIIKTFTGELFDYTEGESDKGDAVLQAIAKVEEELNCSLVFEYETPENMLTNANATILSGEKYADLIIPIMHNLSSLMASSLLQDLKTVPNLDLSKDYFDKRINEFATIKDKQYFTHFDLLGSFAGGTSCVFFNKRIVSELQLENPYDLVKNDKWTIDKFREMSKAAMKDLDGQSSWTAEDQWGIAGFDHRHTFAQSVLAASDAPYLVKNDKGVIQYNAGHPNVLKGFELAQNIVFQDKAMFTGDAPSVDKQFVSGKALFYTPYLWKLPFIADMADDIGVVPFPKAEGQSEYRGHMEWSAGMVAVPAQLSEEDLGQVGHLIDSIAYHSQNRIPVEIKEFANRYIGDDDAEDMINLIGESSFWDYSLVLASSGNPIVYNATFSVQYAIMDNISNDPFTLFEEVKNSGKTGIREFMNAIGG